METEIKEKELSNVPKSVRVEVLENLPPKMKTHICKIKCSEGGFGTGFFCNIPYKWQLTLKVLITSNHVLKEKDLLDNKIIKFSINSEKKQYNILIDESRKIYSNEKYDITIIELKEKDKIDENFFFDIDNDIFNKNSKEIFIKKDIILLHYPKGEMECSIGIIKYICEDNYTIQHLCSTNYGSSGGTIINSINFKVIGVHRGTAKLKKFNYNLGTFLKEPIKQFKEQIKKGIIKNFCKENINISSKKNANKNNDEIIIQYKINNFKNLNIRIFGDEFVKNNKDKCKIIINGKELGLCSHINININQINNNKIYEIKLNGINKITNMSCMFKGDIFSNIPLFSLLNISKWNTQKILNISGIFYFCSSIKSLPDISKWNTQNVTNMSDIFYGCSSLLSLPDISKWNTQNVTDMNSMFFGCSSLLSLPDISKWNTHNVTNMGYMFYGCSSLLSLPDISKWNIKKVTNMKKRFTGCSSLFSLPYISEQNTRHNSISKNRYKEENKNIKTKKVICKSMNIDNAQKDKNIINTNKITIQYKFINIKNKKRIRIFGDEFVKNNKDKCKIIINGKELDLCSHINFNINQLNNNEKYEIKLIGINNITNLSRMFSSEYEDEIQLLSLTDISKWNTKNVTNMSDMFNGCSSLLSLPDISKLNIQNVTNMSYLFYRCSSIKSLPDISKWNTQNVTNIKGMFSGCLSLSSLPDISKWNTQNIIDMSYMFFECSSLSSLPDISKWKTQNIIDVSYMFYHCTSLLSLADISKWNTKNVKNIRGMFEGTKILNIPKKFQEEINNGCSLF